MNSLFTNQIKQKLMIVSLYVKRKRGEDLYIKMNAMKEEKERKENEQM
jgi:hypothetical protein